VKPSQFSHPVFPGAEDKTDIPTPQPRLGLFPGEIQNLSGPARAQVGKEKDNT
jgi:hypothetical protein